MASGINLFQTKTQLSPALAEAEQYVRIIALALLAVLCAGGIVIGSLFIFFEKQKNTLEGERRQALGTIEGYINKETMLVVIHERLNFIDRVFATQQSFAPFIDTTIKIIGTRPLTSFSLGEQNTVSIALSLSSMNEAVTIISGIMGLESSGLIKNTIIDFLTLDENETVKLGVSYKVIL